MQFEPIAIVAADCRLPGAARLEDFYTNNRRAVCSIRKAEEAFWDGCETYDKNAGGHTNTSYTDLGGFLDPWQLDPGTFRIAPRVIERMDPVHALGMELAHRVIGRAERSSPLPRDATAVIVANVAGGSTSRVNANMKVQTERWAAAVRRREPALANVLDEVQERERERYADKREDLALNGESGTIGGRIANYFDLRGAHYGIDAACGSSLAAVHSACMGLDQGEFDAALVTALGILTPDIFVVNSAARTLSAQGAFPFGAAAGGLVPGEGGVGMLLTRLSDARREGRPVLGVIRGIGYSTNGRTTSTWAPSAEAEERAIRGAFDGMPFGMQDVDYVEAHGTSTQAGDGAELAAMTRTYGSVPRPRPLPFGSAKSLIGHTVESAGLVGMLRGLFVFGSGCLPPTVNVDGLRREAAEAADRLRLQRSAEPLARVPGRPWRIGVSAFGYGGINYHLLLEQPEGQSAGEPRTRPARRPARVPVAITAVEAVQPDAADADAFWQNLRAGLASSRDLRARVPGLQRDLDDAGLKRQAEYLRNAALTDVPQTVDNARFRILPKQVPDLTDEYLVLLSCAANLATAVEHATASIDPARAGCIIGQLPDSDREFELMQSLRFMPWLRRLRGLARARGIEAPWQVLRDELWNDPALDLHAVNQDTSVAGFGSTLASCLASSFDLRGKSYAVRAACATGLAALSLALQELRQHTLDFVLCGAVGMGVGLVNHSALASIRALSGTGAGRPYDDQGDGFIMGGGAGLLCLKRLTDAERDGDPILAVVREVRGGSDGKGRSLLAPNAAGRRLAMERTYRGADLDPAGISYVEGHGAATALGDRSEVEALSGALANKETVFLGSVKGNVGHQKAAAGMTSVIKTVLCLQRGELVPTPGFENPHRALELESRRFRVLTETMPWPAPHGGAPRRAAVNAFGLGGVNYHAVLEEYVPPRSGRRPVARAAVAEAEPAHTAVWTAPGSAEMLSALTAFAEHGEAPPAAAADHAHRLAIHTGTGPEADRVLRQRVRRYLATGPGTLAPGQWDAMGVFTGRRDVSPGRVCRLYPGQGSQYAGMLREGARAVDGAGARLRAAADALAAELPGLLDGFWHAEPGASDAWLSRTENCQVATLVVSTVLGDWLTSLGVPSDSHLGHSFGEISALTAAGALSFEDALRTAHRRGVIAGRARDGGPSQSMAVLFTSAAQGARLIGEDESDVVIANWNSRRQIVLAGRAAAITRVLGRAAAEGIEGRALPIERAFHSPLLGQAVPRYREFLDEIPLTAPSAPVYETRTSRPYPQDAEPDRIRQSLADQYVLPVYYETMIRDAYDRGARVFVETGPKRALSSLVTENLGASAEGVRIVHLLHPKGGELTQLERAAAQLWAIGLTDTDPVRAVTTREVAP
ncbi:acyltransferase domain-containing protein [Streptomyces avidinii]|uniref:beta-ketoacyl synthase N-terminal-like domain-containing protein n=1 Tax=Streptomyces avidinii TaxID=1895 RepID=UPI00386C8522|nr:acyltransferase domain-containing protein [Streptomyces avidinii]